MKNARLTNTAPIYICDASIQLSRYCSQAASKHKQAQKKKRTNTIRPLSSAVIYIEKFRALSQARDDTRQKTLDAIDLCSSDFTISVWWMVRAGRAKLEGCQLSKTQK